MSRLFSGIRAAAATFGRAIGGTPRNDAPPEPARLDRLDRAFDRMRAESMNQLAAEQAEFEQAMALARSLTLGRPMADEILRLIVMGNDIRLSQDGWDGVLRSLRALTPAQRGAMFDLFFFLKGRLAWPVTLNSYGGKEVKHRFGRCCELLKRDLLSMGFEVTPQRAAQALALMADDDVGQFMKGIARWSTKPNLRLGVLRDIERAVRNGLVLSTADRNNAAATVALIHESSQKSYGTEKNDLPVVQSLKALAGVEQQDSFFVRMHAATAPRFPTLRYTPPAADKARFWDDVLVEVATLFADIRHYAESERQSRSWLTDQGAFRARFGDGDGHCAFRFGWWARDTRGEDGFHKDVNNYVSRTLAAGEAFSQEILTPADTAHLRGAGQDFGADWPFQFGTQGIPLLDRFAFGGRDEGGDLFNHLAAAGDGSPGPVWGKECGRLIDKVGRDEALSLFAEWLGMLANPVMPEVDRDLYIGLEAYGSVFNERHAWVFPESLPDREGPGYEAAVRAASLKALCGLPGLTFRRRAGDHVPWKNEEYRLRAAPSDNNIVVARGIAFALSLYQAEAVLPLLERLAHATLALSDERRHPRSPKGGSAALWSLGQIGTAEAAFALGRIRRVVADKPVLKAIDKALAAVGDKLGFGADEMQEIAMADHGIGDGGVRRIELSGHVVELRVTSSSKAELRSINPAGKVSRGISKAVLALEGGKEIAAELGESVKDIELILPEARRRIEASWRSGRNWDYAGWRDRLIGNGLLRTLAERLVWRFVEPDGRELVALPTNGGLVDADGAACAEPSAQASVHLWHTLDGDAATVEAWREMLAARRIRQPFIQAWRPIYVVTDAERATATYSNRFAGHILEQAPVMAILKKRGWMAFNRKMDGNSAEHERVRLSLPHFGVAAEFWVAGVGTRIQQGQAAEQGGLLYAFISTDRVSFYALDKAGKPEGEPLPVDQVPARAFCEAMYDIDTIVGRTSIGADRHWQDRGAGAAHPLSEVPEFIAYRQRYASGQTGELARSRHDFLATILPALAIADQCQLEKDFLIVDGKRNTYKINLGSGNILIAPNDRYLCIVRASAGSDSYVPFEGDEILSMILSKAMMLADDDKITEPHILNQLAHAQRR